MFLNTIRVLEGDFKKVWDDMEVLERPNKFEKHLRTIKVSWGFLAGLKAISNQITTISEATEWSRCF